MQFELAKSLRRRRLAAGDGKTAGDKGTFGFNLKTGNCVRPKDDDGDCGAEPKKKEPTVTPTETKDKKDAGEGSFA